LSDLDEKSHLIGTVAANFYSSVRDPKKLDWVVKFLDEYGRKNIGQNWRYLIYAGSIANSDLKNTDLAVKILEPLTNLDKDSVIPSWARFMGFFYLQSGLKTHDKVAVGCASLAFLRSFDKKDIEDLTKNGVADAALQAVLVQRILEIKKLGDKIKNCI
jgi:hypothetical protein